MSSHPNIIFLPSVNSTNEYAAALVRGKKAQHLQIVQTAFQSAGKGQKGSSWESEAGKNLTFTIILFPGNLEVTHAFYLNIITSLAVTDALARYYPDIRIKWPNDIYAGSRKLAGILIENVLEKNTIASSLVGIGINVNQTVFRSDAPNPVSLKQLTKQEYDLATLLEEIYRAFVARYRELENYSFPGLMHDYTGRLLGFQASMKYRANDRIFTARIMEVKETGEMVLMEDDGSRHIFSFKEVELVF